MLRNSFYNSENFLSSSVWMKTTEWQIHKVLCSKLENIYPSSVQDDVQHVCVCVCDHIVQTFIVTYLFCDEMW